MEQKLIVVKVNQGVVDLSSCLKLLESQLPGKEVVVELRDEQDEVCARLVGSKKGFVWEVSPEHYPTQRQAAFAALVLGFTVLKKGQSSYFLPALAASGLGVLAAGVGIFNYYFGSRMKPQSLHGEGGKQAGKNSVSLEALIHMVAERLVEVILPCVKKRLEESGENNGYSPPLLPKGPDCEAFLGSLKKYQVDQFEKSFLYHLKEAEEKVVCFWFKRRTLSQDQADRVVDHLGVRYKENLKNWLRSLPMDEFKQEWVLPAEISGELENAEGSSFSSDAGRATSSMSSKIDSNNKLLESIFITMFAVVSKKVESSVNHSTGQ
jgi:hypothetical protein